MGSQLDINNSQHARQENWLAAWQLASDLPLLCELEHNVGIWHVTYYQPRPGNTKQSHCYVGDLGTALICYVTIFILSGDCGGGGGGGVSPILSTQAGSVTSGISLVRDPRWVTWLLISWLQRNTTLSSHQKLSREYSPRLLNGSPSLCYNIDNYK